MTTKKIDITDPVTGEVSELVPENRRRIRDVFLNEGGAEIPDPRPLSPPVGYNRQPSMFEIVRAQVRQAELDRDRDLPESFEEAEDFDIYDDPIDPSTQWENEFDPPWSEVRLAIEADRKKRAETPPESSKSPPDPKPEAAQGVVPPLAKQDIP